MRSELNQHKVPAALVAILIAALYFFFLRAQTAKALTQQVETLQEEIAALPEPASYKQPGMGPTFSWIRSMPDFLRDLTQWAKNRSIDIVSIEPGETQQQNGYTEQPVRIEIQGRFRTIGNYLTFLEELPRPIQIIGLGLTSPADIAPDLLARLELVVYIRDVS